MMLPLAFRAGDGPVFFGCVRVTRLRQLHRLHHLAHRPVGQQHRRHPVFFREVKRLSGQVGHLLDRRRSQHQHMEVAVAGAARCEEVVRLRRLDAAEAGPAALHIDNDRGQIRARQIRNALALERDAGAGGRGHRPLARRGHAVDHVDGRDLALGLQKCPADLRHFLRHIGRDLGLRRDGIAQIVAAPGEDRGLRNGLVALHQYLFLHRPILLTFLP